MGALDGRIAVVAGASRGIGRGCALELAAAGASVYALPGSLETTAREARELGGTVVPVVCDLRSDAALAAAFARVAGERRGLDVLVNSAFDLPEGCANGTPFFETPISYWDDLLGIGARSAYAATWHAAQLMLPRGAGLVANISSQGAREYFVHATYGIAKSALDRITRDSGRDLAPRGVAVVSLWPGYVRTERLLALDAEGWGVDLEGSESPRFAGRGVVALAADPDVVKRAGRVFTTRQLAEAYGFRDVDGTLPRGAPDPETYYPPNP